MAFISDFSLSPKIPNGFYNNLAIYNAVGDRVEYFVYNKASVPPRGSLAEKALAIVCHNLGAAGW